MDRAHRRRGSVRLLAHGEAARTRGLKRVECQEAKALGQAGVGVAHDLGVAHNHAKGGEGVVQQLRGSKG